jgi:transposase-like protein
VLALAIRLRLPGLRREASQRHQEPRALPVYRLSAADILDCWNDFRCDQGATVYLVSRHVPPHPEQGRHLQHRVGAPAWRYPDHGLEDQAQTHAGDDGAGRREAPDGRIEVDDAYLGGERNGGKRGRGSPGKTPIVAAVETTPEGKPIRLKLRRVKGFRRAEIATLAQRNFHPASTVVSDGLHCFTGVGNAGCVHQPIITGSGRKAALNPAFKWVNTTLGNIKSAITATYRTIRHKHVPRYLAEFEYRFNRRYDLAAMMPRLGYVAVRTPPMPYRLLKLAEDHA